MKKFFLLIFALIACRTIVLAQEAEKTTATITLNSDLVSRYVWRGTDFGSAPAIQPALVFNYGNFQLGAWGSFSLSGNTGGTETDLFAGYTLPFGLGVTVTDYYFPLENKRIDWESGTVFNERSGNYFNINNHIIELAAKQEIGSFYLMGAYYANLNDDLYLEAGYSHNNISVFAGAGNESYTDNAKWNVCQVGLRYQKQVDLTEKLSITPFSTLVVNPSSEQMHFVVGVSF